MSEVKHYESRSWGAYLAGRVHHKADVDVSVTFYSLTKGAILNTFIEMTQVQHVNVWYGTRQILKKQRVEF